MADYTANFDISETLEPKADQGLVGFLKTCIKEYGRDALLRAVQEALGEDAASDHDEQSDIPTFDVPEPMDVSDVLTHVAEAGPNQPLAEIDLGDRQDEKVAHLKYRGITTPLQLIAAMREEIPEEQRIGLQIISAIYLFGARFVPLVLVEFDQNPQEDAGIHRRLEQVNCTTVWDVTQTPPIKLRSSFNTYELERITTTFEEKLGITLPPPKDAPRPPELKPTPRKPLGRRHEMDGPGGI